MKQSAGQKATIKDKTQTTLERVVDYATSDGEPVQAYLCSLQLPKQFSTNQHLANDIYKKVISDFGKHVMRKTGETPRYVTVRKENANNNPEYAFCLFTKDHSSLSRTEAFVEKGREIANGKAGQAGWGRGKLDIIELFRDAPKFTISAQPITITNFNKHIAMTVLQEHLENRCADGEAHQRNLFVSKSTSKK